ncbi:hypothetical protein C1645_550224 [Glomus cerebriforme]|uniref:Protein kinase domain-containing protein n=1 Tax=Glomus cerebriforme TaxID=658196 RepID=A0A397S6H0_9GLOM|nr:hypothetical protein C1645_550224 [Glomus cerebriforme]
MIKTGKSFNNHLSKLITALKKHDNKIIQNELDGFINDPYLNWYHNDSSNIVLSQWYYIANQTYIDHIGTPLAEIEIKGGRLFNTTRRFLNNTTIAGKSLKYLNNENFLCMIKEICLYNDRQLNNNDYIIEFRGYSIQHCKCTLFYDYSDYGDLFEYFQRIHTSSEHNLKEWKNKIRLAWEISMGVKYLHDVRMIIFLLCFFL